MGFFELTADIVSVGCCCDCTPALASALSRGVVCRAGPESRPTVHVQTDDDVIVTMEDVSRMFPTTDDSQAMNQAQFKDAIRRIYNMDISRHSE